MGCSLMTTSSSKLIRNRLLFARKCTTNVVIVELVNPRDRVMPMFPQWWLTFATSDMTMESSLEPGAGAGALSTPDPYPAKLHANPNLSNEVCTNLVSNTYS
ncbi:hypothetical protein J6590_099478 [Homalodisca vitripennis]|nr:hypothetical protein J6590_099478 [Homalodisca vitripennis]